MTALDRPEEWVDSRFVFYLATIHGKEEMSRRERTKERESREPTWVWCDEHKDYEGPRRRITGKQALRWAQSRLPSPSGREKK